MLERNWNISWNEGFSVGIPEVDGEHRYFISLIDGLNRAIENRVELAEIQKIMQRILEDWKRHAANEEAAFARHYPNAMEHVKQHELVNQQLHAIMAEIDGASFGYEWISAALRIRDILIEHLLQADMNCRD